MATASKNFTPISEEYRQKYYPKGFFVAMAKSGGGVILIVLGLITAIIGLLMGVLTVGFLVDILQGKGVEGGASTMIFLGGATLVFFIPGVLVIRFGLQRKRMGADAWIKKSAEVSGYPESVIRDFGNQAIQADSIRFQLQGKMNAPLAAGILTRDYIYLENLISPCVMKRGDIKCAYLVSLPDSVVSGNKVKHIYKLSLAIFSSRKTFMISQTQEGDAKELVERLLNKNSVIDTAEGRVLLNEEYEKLVSGLR